MILLKMDAETREKLRPHHLLFQALVSQRAAELVHARPSATDATLGEGGIRLEQRDIAITKYMIKEDGQALTKVTRLETATKKAIDSVVSDFKAQGKDIFENVLPLKGNDPLRSLFNVR